MMSKYNNFQNLTFNERIAQMGGDNGRFSRKLAAETSFETYFENAIDSWRGEDQGPDLGRLIFKIRKICFVFRGICDGHSSKRNQDVCSAAPQIGRHFQRTLRAHHKTWFPLHPCAMWHSCCIDSRSSGKVQQTLLENY